MSYKYPRKPPYNKQLSSSFKAHLQHQLLQPYLSLTCRGTWDRRDAAPLSPWVLRALRSLPDAGKDPPAVQLRHLQSDNAYGEPVYSLVRVYSSVSA